MDFVVPPPTQPSLPVAGTTARFPVRRIWCVGRNYAEHAREFGHDPDREPPFFFSKPADALLTDGQGLPYPPQTGNLHFEAELVVALGTGGHNISQEAALGHIWGYAAGNDFTRRDLQAVAKELGRPWDLAKGFDFSAACGALSPAAAVGHLARGRIALSVDGVQRQEADLSDMIWSVDEIISALSASVTLKPGDLIYTGTPAGVGAVERGQTVRVDIDGLSSLVTPIT
ncbi:fumarylpyruvate hydrolase [Mesorhizobium soli]|uniref:fumarylacetoacetate hydrolase family protein n=1 Tax=Pseudaminobacter soli (ex Li et al. 2025) TaxID=1295366 RepID=UPI002476F336|nr:fumarylacetoacetate hydrolase family protein [Mesorhizobium soli]MDH6234598.1 fumarylpyruvate hydrolase [Mesorhizobium soli]